MFIRDRNNGVQCYIRIFSIIGAVLYRAVKEKTIDAMHRIRFPEKFTRTRIHDYNYETAVYHYKKTKQKYAKSDKRSLRNRMDKYRYNHLLFLETLKHEKEENGQCIKTSRDYVRAHPLFFRRCTVSWFSRRLNCHPFSLQFIYFRCV